MFEWEHSSKLHHVECRNASYMSGFSADNELRQDLIFTSRETLVLGLRKKDIGRRQCNSHAYRIYKRVLEFIAPVNTRTTVGINLTPTHYYFL